MHVVRFVKHFTLSLIVASFLLYTPLAHAQTLSSTQRNALLNRIESLVTQVHMLQKQLALLQHTKVKKLAEFSYKTKFYTGSYEALYHTDDSKLAAPEGLTVRTGDQLLWNTFVDIVGDTSDIQQVSEFRIYNDPTSEISAFVEEKPDQTWILGFNREGSSLANIYQDDAIIHLLVHEYGHIVFFSNPNMEKNFTNQFWDTKQSSGDFITKYAATSAIEDLAETFAYFVTNDKPTNKGVQFEKVRFLYNYPSLVRLRQQLRESDLL